MKFHTFLGLGVLSLSLMSGAAAAADKNTKKAEVDKATQTALAHFYQAKPELQAAVDKAPGYGIFTTYGVSFLIGGSGGSGVVHNNATKKNTYMSVGGASAGVQLGASETEMLIIFKTAAAMNKFVEKGWVASGSATAGAGAGASGSVGGGKGSNAMEDAESYTYTKKGVEAGLALGTSKFWKDNDLN